MDLVMYLVLGGVIGAGIYVYQDIKKTFSFGNPSSNFDEMKK